MGCPRRQTAPHFDLQTVYIPGRHTWGQQRKYTGRNGWRSQVVMQPNNSLPWPHWKPKTKLACQNCHVLDWNNWTFIPSYESVIECGPLQDREWPWMNGSLSMKQSLNGVILEAICGVHAQILGQHLPWRNMSPKEPLKSWRRTSAQQRENQERQGRCFQICDKLSCGRDTVDKTRNNWWISAHG